MLTNVPTAVSRMTRNIVINHPNTWGAQVFRKVVNRDAPEKMGGIPTMGGMGVLDNEDEENIEFQHMGDGYALSAEAFQPSPMMDLRDANMGAAEEFRFLIEPASQSGEPGWFDVRKHDMLFLVITDSVKLAFEVMGTETTSNIPPYNMRYICNRRADIDVSDGVLSGYNI